MTETERAEALAYAERARARAFPVWWRRLAYAVIAFGLMKAGSLVCCVPTVGGVLAIFGVRSLWVELGLLAALAVGIGWLLAKVRDREARERAGHFLRVAEDIAAGEIREVRWQCVKAWFAAHDEVGGDQSSIAFQLGPDDFLLYPEYSEVTSTGRRWPGSRDEKVAHSVRIVLLPISQVLLVGSSTFEDWHAVRWLHWPENPDESDRPPQSQGAWRFAHRGSLSQSVQTQVDAEIDVDSTEVTSKDRPWVLGPKNSVLRAWGAVAATIAAGAAAGFLLGLVIDRSWDTATKFAIIAAICLVGAWLIIATAVGIVIGGAVIASRIARWLDPDSVESAGGGPYAWTESFDAERVELLTRAPGGKVIGAAWYTQGLEYRLPADLLDADLRAGRPRRRVRVTFESSPEGMIATELKHSGEAVACSVRTMTWGKAGVRLVCRGAEVSRPVR